MAAAHILTLPSFFFICVLTLGTHIPVYSNIASIILFMVLPSHNFFLSNASLHGPLNLTTTTTVLVNAVSLCHLTLLPQSKVNFAWKSVLSEVAAHYSVHAWHLRMTLNNICQPENQWNIYTYIFMYVNNRWFPSGVGSIKVCFTNGQKCTRLYSQYNCVFIVTAILFTSALPTCCAVPFDAEPYFLMYCYKNKCSRISTFVSIFGHYKYNNK